jgi:large subunit ribosomal protein L23
VYGNPGRLGRKRRGGDKVKEQAGDEAAKFPWSGMRLATEKRR